ncbi:MAG: hypothetical protein ACOZIN_02080 [Myxococcota bacterium]
MAKGNGRNGEARIPAWVHLWWSRAKEDFKAELKAELEPRFQSIETKLVVMDVKLDALDKRVTRIESRD